MSRPIELHVEWFRLLADLKRHGFSLRSVREQTGIPESTLRGYAIGSEPKHMDGEALIMFWCRATDRQREQLPLEPIALSAAVVKSRP